MAKDLRYSQPLLWVELDHPFDEYLSFVAEFTGECEVTFQDQLVKILEVRSLKRYCSAQHSK